MSFKDEYKKLQRQIAPDEDFIERLSEKLQKEEVKKKKNKSRFRAVTISVTAACAAAAAALVIIIGRPQRTLTRDPDILGVGAEKIDRVDGLFTSFGTQSGTVSPEELAQILSDKDSAVYGSEKETFDFEDKLDTEKRRELAERIANAEETFSEPSGKATYYMAVSKDGKIVKFSVAGNVLTISDKRYLI